MSSSMVDRGEVECSYCMEYGRYLQNPKTLPCSHSVCEPCLHSVLQARGVFPCPICSEEYHGLQAMNSPEADLTGSSTPEWCNVCQKGEKATVPAALYCKDCDRKFCTAHAQSHDDIYKYDDHKCITINAYMTMSTKLQPRFCTEHSRQPLAIACSKCFSVSCVMCMTPTQMCNNGDAGHSFVSIDKLSEELIKKCSELEEKTIEKKRKLYEMTRKCTTYLSEHEQKTGELISRIHEQRDEQIEAINKKYLLLEEEIREKRRICHTEISNFVDTVLDVKLAELRKSAEWLSNEMQERHKVDLILEFNDIQKRINNLLEEELPCLFFDSCLELIQRDLNREIELATKATKRISISSVPSTLEQTPERTTSHNPPSSLLLVKSVQIGGYCTNVKSGNGQVLCGLDECFVSKIDSSGNLTRRFIELRSRIAGLDVGNGHVFVSVDGYPNIVSKFDGQGKTLATWNHSDMKGCWSSNLAVIGDQVAMLDKAGRRIVLYTLTGELIKSIPCGIVRGRWASICVADEDCVVISVYETSTVAKIKISTGSMLWLHEGITGAQGVTCYKGQYVLVASEGLMTNITVLDLHSGASVAQLASLSGGRGTQLKSCVFSLCMTDDDLLVVPRYADREICYYKLVTQEN